MGIKVIVRKASPSEGTADEILDRFDSAKTDLDHSGTAYGGIDADYELITVDSGDESDCSSANLATSAYNRGGGTFIWVAYAYRYDYLAITTSDSPVADGSYEVTADNTDTITIDVQKKKGSDDTNMTAAGDNEKIIIESVTPLGLDVGLTPSLTNGAISIVVKSNISANNIRFCVGGYTPSDSLGHSNELILRFV